MTTAIPAPPAPPRRGAAAWLSHEVRELYPGYFALVMATGIVANALLIDGWPRLSDALLALSVAAFVALALGTIARCLCFPRRVGHDLLDPGLVFTFFTTVAAANVLGLELAVRGDHAIPVGLWLFGFAVWLPLGYFGFALLTFVNTERRADVIHAGWLIMIVGTESLVLLGAHLTPHLGGFERLANVVIYTLWGIGIVLYGVFMAVFSARIFFGAVEPPDMLPLFWVVMGAAAIATNAGSTLIVTPPHMPFLAAMRPFVNGTTLILWAWATWWIPLLAIFGLWRHVVRRHPLTYDPRFWSVVFPLGMYAVATYRLSLAADYPPVLILSQVMVWVAFAAWLATMGALLAAHRRSLHLHRRHAEPA